MARATVPGKALRRPTPARHFGVDFAGSAR